jgi:chromosome segregation ATPase
MNNEITDDQQKYMKTYVSVLMGTLMETIQTSTDAKARMAMLDAICKEQQEQIAMLNNTIEQMNSGLVSTHQRGEELDQKVASLESELNALQINLDRRTNELDVLRDFEGKFNRLSNEHTTVVNNYHATKVAYENLANKYNDLDSKYKAATEQYEEIIKKLQQPFQPEEKIKRVKQKSQDTGWS